MKINKEDGCRIIYKNKKNGKLYKRIAIGTDTTNCRDVTSVVYCPCDNEQSIYIRDKIEFDEKFDLCSGTDKQLEYIFDDFVGIEANRIVGNVKLGQ